MTAQQIADTLPVRHTGENHTAPSASLTLQPPPVQPSLFAVSSVGIAEAADTSTERLVICSVESLKPHPALVRLGLLPTPGQLLALEKIGEFLFEKVLLITQDNLIIDGLECWQIAQSQGRTTLLCQVCLVSDEEALYRFLLLENRPKWLNGFSRVRLALNLEPWLRARALANQIAGGKLKALSKLTKAEKHNCREEISKLSGESGANVDKVRKILDAFNPQLIEAARSGEVSINQAWKLSELKRDEQQAALASKRSKKRSQRRLRELLSRNVQSDSIATCLHELKHVLTRMKAIPRLCPYWEKIDDLLSAIDNSVLEDGRDLSEQQA